jgi:hypothetical protein
MLTVGQKMNSIFLETPYFSGMVCPVGVLAPAKIVNVTGLDKSVLSWIFNTTLLIVSFTIN